MGSDDNKQVKDHLREGIRQFASAATELQKIKDTLDTSTKGLAPDEQKWIGDASQQFQDAYHSFDNPFQHAINGLQDASTNFTSLVTAIENAEYEAAFLQLPLFGSTTTFVSVVKLPLSSMTPGADNWSIDFQGIAEGLTDPFTLAQAGEIASELIDADQGTANLFDTINYGLNDQGDPNYYIPDPSLQADNTDLLPSPLAPAPTGGGGGGGGGGGSFGGGGGSFGGGSGIPSHGGAAGAGVPALGGAGAGGSHGTSSPELAGTTGTSSIPNPVGAHGSSNPSGIPGTSSTPDHGTSSIPDHGSPLIPNNGSSSSDPSKPGTDNAGSADAAAGDAVTSGTPTSSDTSAQTQIMQDLAIGEMAAAVVAVGLTAATLGASDALALSAVGGLQAASTGADTPSVSGVDTLSENDDITEAGEPSEDEETTEDEEPSESEVPAEGESIPEGDGTPETEGIPEGEGTLEGGSTPEGASIAESETPPEGELLLKGKQTSEDEEDTPAKPAKPKQPAPAKLADTEPIPQLSDKL